MTFRHSAGNAGKSGELSAAERRRHDVAGTSPGKPLPGARRRTPAGAQESAHGKKDAQPLPPAVLRRRTPRRPSLRPGSASGQCARHLPQKRAPQRADFAAQRRIRASPRAERRKMRRKACPKRAGRSSDRAGFDKASGAGSATRRGRLNLRRRAVPGNVDGRPKSAQEPRRISAKAEGQHVSSAEAGRPPRSNRAEPRAG